MLEEDYDKWPVNLIANNVLDELGSYLTSFGYLKDGPP